MRRYLGVALAVVLLAGCATDQPTSDPTPSATTTPAQPATVAAIVIAGTGISSEDADGNQLETVAFGAGLGAVEAFLTSALGVAPTNPADNRDCIVSSTVTQWGDETAGVVLRVPETYDDPALGPVVIANAASVNGVSIRGFSGFSVGDDVSGVPETLPPSQTVGLDDSLGFEGSTNFVFDPVGSYVVDGTEYAFGASAIAEKGVAIEIFSPRPSARPYC